MRFPPVRRLKVAEQIADTLRDAILTGRFGPGDPLPSERELAEQLEVNRSTVREALTRLEARGLVEIRHGGGARVQDFLTTAGLYVLPWLVRPAVDLDAALLRDLMELRVVLLGWTGRRAAERADLAGVRTLRAALARVEAAADADALRTADFDFFEALVGLTGNRVLAMLAHAVRRVYLENGALFAALYEPDAFDAALHRAAVDAVAAGDAEAAATAMTAYASRGLAAWGPR